ncbi:hypothetical protein D7X55_09335 [Corallococcus sp. AB049A]|uniref:Uncharacterized protein n=1 Tax=Corallococcus interemptor TaxID=2316720 RepID=A0A3A8QP00_9BACT|nr:MULTISPECIES: hypothetical protein [Corallococcus]RKH49924.1 hypothetical protein D7Y23_15175 [Corallococcus sp. AB050B]RKH68075.1 hypothetical protein D7X96_18120 [Corallococcus interemptor]RKI71212.1 hypothetical protein D7X55_09335 [Corallococcus sp. AB049A]
MRLFRRLAHSSLATLFVLALPLAQAQAQDCVQFSGMKHCATGAAKLVVDGKELLVQSADASGNDGVVVDTAQAKGWSAGLAHEPSGEARETTVKTVISDGKVVAASVVTETSEGQEFAASFVDANGKPATYSAMVFREGQLVASVSGISSGSVGARSVAGLGKKSCTTLTYKACMKLCLDGPIGCAYCKVPCIGSVNQEEWVLSNGKYPYLDFSLQSPFGAFSVGDAAKAAPQIVVGDQLVLISDVPSEGAQGIDQVVVQSTAKTVSLSNETVSR